jgi:hypothetical protein
LKYIVADNKNELSEITFAPGFKGITDIETGLMDICIYSVTYGKLSRIVPN